MEHLTGTIEHVLQHSPETGAFVVRIIDRERKQARVAGYAPRVIAGEALTAEGSWVGRADQRQFEASKTTVAPPRSVEGIRRYLSSGAIKGIGAAYADKLIAAFGDDVFEVIDKAPARLRDVAGIGEERASAIVEAWHEQRAIREIMVFLHANGVTTAKAARIYRAYGTDAVKVVLAKPLAFCAANERRLSAGVLVGDEALSRSEELPGANWMGKALTHIRDTLLSPLLPLTDESVGRASTNRERAILLGLSLYYLEKAAGIWGRRFKIGEIGIGLRGRSAGRAYLESFNIVYNERLFLENPEHFINGTVPHEVAHIVATQLYGPRIPGHGAEWKSVMKALGHVPQRCHDLSVINTGADVGKRMIATCGNHLFLLSPKRSASSRRCKKCQRTLRALWPEQEVRDAIERLRKQGRPL